MRGYLLIPGGTQAHESVGSVRQCIHKLSVNLAVGQERGCVHSTSRS